jgi:hypothetical protein
MQAFGSGNLRADAYDSRYARWNLNDLPIVPEKWQLQPRPSVTKQLNVIQRFLHDAAEIIHAGDPDREGQLPMKVICAGQSDAGMAFSAEHADFNFCFGKGVNTPAAFAPTAARMQQAAEKTGREVGSYVLFMVIADETDDAARAKWEHYKAGADDDALSWLTEQSQKDTRSGADTNVRSAQPCFRPAHSVTRPGRPASASRPEPNSATT